MGFPLAPWHMWGGTRVLVTNAAMITNPADALPAPPVQLAKISYARPETWSFFFGARLIGGDTPTTGASVLTVGFDVIVGIGRSSYSTQQPAALGGFVTAFHQFVFSVPIGSPPGTQPSNAKYVTQILAPIVDDTAAAAARLPIQWLPGQDIQVSARILDYLVGAASSPVTRVQCSAYFAPRTHVRPEWMAEVPSFRGEEQTGS